jgi:hypothetical protein
MDKMTHQALVRDIVQGTTVCRKAWQVFKKYPDLPSDPDADEVYSYIMDGKGAEIPEALMQRFDNRYPGIGKDPQVKQLLEMLTPPPTEFFAWVTFVTTVRQLESDGEILGQTKSK